MIITNFVDTPVPSACVPGTAAESPGGVVLPVLAVSSANGPVRPSSERHAAVPRLPFWRRTVSHPPGVNTAQSQS